MNGVHSLVKITKCNEWDPIISPLLMTPTMDNEWANSIKNCSIQQSVLIVVIALSILIVNVVDEGLIVIIVGDGCIIIVVALSKGLIDAFEANGLLVIIGGNVTVLGILDILLMVALGKGLVVSTKATTTVAAMLPRLPLQRTLSLQLPHFVDCSPPPPFLLLSAAARATVPIVATATPILTSTPSLDNLGIVALSSLSSLAPQSLIFDYKVPALLWLLSLLSTDVALVFVLPQLALFVCTG
jgi:hypothetical protein